MPAIITRKLRKKRLALIRSKARRIIREAYIILKPEGRWTQNVMARRKDGRECSWSYSEACRFCMSGAMWKAHGSFYLDGAMELAQYIVKDTIARITNGLQKSITGYNDYDHRTKGEVLRVLEIAGR